MGFRDAKAAVAAALRKGDFEHEARGTLDESNLLAVGEVSADFVLELVLKTQGTQYTSSLHHWDSSVEVHTFKPVVGKERWYVKAYFLGNPPKRAVFISVHRSRSTR